MKLPKDELQNSSGVKKFYTTRLAEKNAFLGGNQFYSLGTKFCHS